MSIPSLSVVFIPPNVNPTNFPSLMNWFSGNLSAKLLTYGHSNGPGWWPTWAMPVFLSFVGIVALFIGIRWLIKAVKRVK